LSVTNFPAGTPVSIQAGSTFMGRLTTTAEGYAIFHILFNSNQVNSVQVTVSSGATGGAVSVSATLTTAANQPLHAMEGSAPIFVVQPRNIYLPLTWR
jgi:hypothetical protein